MYVYVILSILLSIVILCIVYHNKNKDIIVPDIVGGIGNQLFIIASAYAYGRRNNKELVLDGRSNIHSYGGYRHNNNNTIFYHINKNNNLPKLTNLSEGNYHKKVDGNIYLTDGYYQDYQYFNEYKQDIIELFTPSDDILHDIDNLRDKYNMNNNYNICIHIRLTDKFTDPTQYSISDEEIDIIKHKLSNLDGNKLVFSNDIQKCKNIFINHNDLTYVDEEDYLVLYLMSHCNYYIASPSTFNWWGIYLNKGKYDVFLAWKTGIDYNNDLYRNDFYKKYKLFVK